MRKQLKVVQTKEEAPPSLRRYAHHKAKCGQEIEQTASDSKNLGTQKESFFHLQEIRKMDARVMYEDTSLNNLKRTARWDSNSVALYNAIRKARSGVSCSYLFNSFLHLST